MTNIIRFVVLAFATVSGSLCAQTNLLPLLRGETVHSFGGGGFSVKLGHNGCEAVAKEIQETEFRKLLAKILQLPEVVLLRHRYSMGPGCGLHVSSLGISDKDLDSLCTLLRNYVGHRSAGHTARYALDSLQQRLKDRKSEKDGFRERLFSAYPNLPRDWVKEDPFETTVLTTNAAISKTFVVIDGEVAWTYGVPLGNGPIGVVRVDAQEFDPRLRPSFEAAKAEARQNLERQGIKKGFGYTRHYLEEVERILRQKYGIKHRSFRELNPGAIVH